MGYGWSRPFHLFHNPVVYDVHVKFNQYHPGNVKLMWQPLSSRSFTIWDRAMPWGIICMFVLHPIRLQCWWRTNAINACATAVLLGLLLAIGPPVVSTIWTAKWREAKRLQHHIIVSWCKLKQYTILSNSFKLHLPKIPLAQSLQPASLTTAKGCRLTFKPSDFAQGPSAWKAGHGVEPIG